MRALVEAGETPSALTPAALAEAAAEVLGEPVTLDDASLVQALDPAADAEARLQAGSSSQAAIGRDADRCRAPWAA